MFTTQLKTLEQWLEVLIISHQTTPSHSVIQCILYYIDRILTHEDCDQINSQYCQYQSMKKFWLWRATTFKQ